MLTLTQVILLVIKDPYTRWLAILSTQVNPGKGPRHPSGEGRGNSLGDSTSTVAFRGLTEGYLGGWSFFESGPFKEKKNTIFGVTLFPI